MGRPKKVSKETPEPIKTQENLNEESDSLPHILLDVVDILYGKDGEAETWRGIRERIEHLKNEK